MRNIAKRTLALVLSFVMIFTSLPTIASAYTKELNGSSTMYVGETRSYSLDSSKTNRWKWTSSEEAVATVENVNTKTAKVTAISAGVTTIQAKHDENRIFTKTITVLGEKETIKEDVKVKWGESYTLKNINKSLEWKVKEQNKLTNNIPGEENSNVATIDEEWGLVYYHNTYVTGRNIGTITFTAEDNNKKYVVNVEVVTDDEENIDIYVGEERSIGSKGYILKNDANLYSFKILDESIATGRIDNDGFGENKTYIVKGISEGTTYLWKKFDGILRWIYGNEYVFKITVRQRPYFKNIDYTVNEGVPAAVIKSDDENGIQIAHDATISTDFADYADKFEETYEDENFKYTLNVEDSEVEVSDFDANNTKTVTVKANYTIAKKYKQVVYVELLDGAAKNISRQVALQTGYAHDKNKKTYTFTEECEENSEVDVEKYIKSTFDNKGNDNKVKSYELVKADTRVVTGAFDTATNVREVRIYPYYREGKHISIDYKFSFKVPVYGMFGKYQGLKEEIEDKDALFDSIDDLFISTADYDSLKSKVDESNVGKYLDDNHKYQFVDAKFDSKTSKLTIYCAAQRYKFFTEFEGKKREGKDSWTYVARGKSKDFGNMSEKELKDYFKIEDVVADKEDANLTYQLDKLTNAAQYETEAIITAKYVKATYLIYRASFKANDEKVKEDSKDFYVLDRKNDGNFTQAKEDKENIEKIIRENKFDQDIEIENTNEVYKYDGYTMGDKIDNAITSFILLFNRQYKKPVNVKHVLYFEGKTVKEVKTEVKSAIFDENGNAIPFTDMFGKVNEAYEKYALEGYTLDKRFSGSDCMTYDKKSNTITYRYWAKRITIAKSGTYKVLVPGQWTMWGWNPEHKEDRFFNPMFDREVIYLNYNEIGKLDTNKDTYKDITLSNEKNIYAGFESAGDLYKVDEVNVYLEDPVSPATGEFYKATITLTYAYDVQGNCKDENEKYIDNEDGKTHKVICADCEKVLKEAESHEFDGNDVCEKCGYTRVSTLDPNLANKTFDIPAGITKLNFNSELFTKLFTEKFGDYAKDINAYDEENYNKDNASVAPLDADDIFAIFEDKTPEAVLDADENIIGVKFNNLVLPTNYGVNHELNITFNYNGSLYIGQLEESTTNTYSLILPKDISRVENKIKDSFGYTVNNAETKIFNITIDNNNEVYNIINDYIKNDLYREEIIVLDNDNEFSFTGKLHVNKSSKKRKPKNDPNNIIPDDPMPEAGPILNDLRTNRPNDSLTRSEFVAVLSQIFQVMDTGNYKDFNDIDNDPNKAAIQKMSSFEIVKGYVDGSFGPNDFMTREQMYAILARAIKFSGKASALTDEQIATELAKVLDGESVSDWAKIDVATAIEQGIVGADTVNALETITRAETADKLEKFIAVIATESEEIKD